MRNIFIGMLLIFLDFNLDIGSSRIGLIPDWIGYIYMVKGLTELAGFSGKFVKIKPYATGMLAYSAIFYAMDLFGVSAMIGTPFGVILGLLSTGLSLYISYHIVQGIIDIETEKGQDLNSPQLYKAWKLLAVFSIITYVWFIFPALMLVFIIVSFIIGIYYLYIFNITKNLFYQQNK